MRAFDLNIDVFSRIPIRNIFLRGGVILIKSFCGYLLTYSHKLSTKMYSIACSLRDVTTNPKGKKILSLSPAKTLCRN